MDLGDDGKAEAISLETCRHCGAAWLKYLIEDSYYSRSGRWWRVEVPALDRASLSAATARDYIEHAGAGFAGGSYFGSAGHAVEAPIRVA